MRAERVKKILSWYKGGFKLGQQEYRVNPPVTGDIQLIGKATYSLLYLKEAHVLLRKFFRNSRGERDRIAVVKAKHGPVSYLHEHWLMFSIVMGFLVVEGK